MQCQLVRIMICVARPSRALAMVLAAWCPSLTCKHAQLRALARLGICPCISSDGMPNHMGSTADTDDLSPMSRWETNLTPTLTYQSYKRLAWQAGSVCCLHAESQCAIMDAARPCILFRMSICPVPAFSATTAYQPTYPSLSCA